MAKILYGVCGEGFGHSSRTREVCQHLISKGHKIKILSYGKGYKNLSPYFDVEKIIGLRFEYKDNKVQYLSTIFKNLLNAPKATQSINKILKIIGQFKPDLVFSDFEPLSCLAANIKKLPLISIDNQHRITNTKIEYPKKYAFEAEAAKAVINLVIFNSCACLITTFFQTKPLNKKTFLFPPILQSEVLKIKPKRGNYIIVYLTSQFENLIDVLNAINKKFVVYGFDKSAKQGNLVFKKTSREQFLKDLAGCEGIIANAGFTLITESLHLGKPYLALPVAGQFEQVLNAIYLKKLGYGIYWDELDKERVESFLFNIENYRKSLRKYKKENNTRIFKKIDALIAQYTGARYR